MSGLQIRNLRKVLSAIAEGYVVKGEDDRFIVVQNPDADEEAVALRGVDPNLVVDLEELFPVLDQIIFQASLALKPGLKT